MKEEAIRKINRIGKAGSIIALIIKIFMIIGLVGLLLTTVFCGALPKDLFTIKMHSQIEIESAPFSSFISSISNVDEILDGVDNTVDINDVEYAPIAISNENGMLNITMDQKDPTVITKAPIMRAAIVADIAMVLSLICCIYVRKLCKAFETCTTPFNEEIITALRRVAFSLIPWCVFSIYGDNSFRNLFSGTNNINIGVNLGMVAVVVIIFGLSYIFKYGAVLQQESDETI